MNKTMSLRKNSRAARPVAAAATVLLAALLLTGCSSGPSSSVAVASSSSQLAPRVTDTSGPYPGGNGPIMPYSTMFSVISAPLMDISAHFTGETAKLDDPRYDMAVFYDEPGGEAIGSLPTGLPVPVVGRITAPAPEGAGAPYGPAPDGEWIRVMLPSRVALPSATGASLRPFLNQGTGWIWAKDVKVTDSKTYIAVDKAAGTVSVGSVGGPVSRTFLADIGDSVPIGPTFMAEHFASSSTCSGGPMLPLSAQGTNADGLNGQPVNPIAFMGPGDDCFQAGPTDLTPVLPNVIRLSPDDAAELAKYAVPGTPVDVYAAGQGS